MRHLTIAGLTALLLSGVAGAAMAQAGPGATVISGLTCPSTSVLNVGNNRPLIQTQAGALCTNASGGGGGGSNAAAGPTGSAVPADAGYTGFNVSGNLVGVSAANPLPITASGGAVGLLSGSQLVGKVGIDQTTPGTTNAVALPSGADVVEGATADTSSTNTVFGNLQAIKAAAQATTAVGVTTCPVVGAACTQPASAVISIASATTTQVVALSSGKLIYVYNFNVISGGTGNFSLVYGTGSNCGIGTTALTGVYPLTAQSGLAPAGGGIPLFTIPAANALCVVDSASVQMSGSVGYVQQ